MHRRNGCIYYKSNIRGFKFPAGIAVDGSGNLLVADKGGIFKYNSSGGFLGWNGVAQTTPIGGDAGCNSLPAGSKTSGFCVGGTIFNGMADGAFMDPYEVHINGTQMYISDNSLTVSRVSTSGIYGGMIGTAAVPTTSWQPSGTSATSIYGDRFLSGASTTSDSTYIYTFNSTGGGIARFYKATGAFGGWIGNIGLSPTGGDPGCAGAAINTYTPGWCMGGYSQAVANLTSGFPTLWAIQLSGNYFYLSIGNGIAKVDATSGAFVGWIGLIATQPTGGAAGCTTAGVGTFTPGWCLGGAMAGNDLNGDGGFNSGASALYVSGNFIYVTDTNMVKKYNATTGAFVGWIGAVGTNPTGGAVGCTTTGVNNFTPGWCTGGATNGGGVGNAVPGMLLSTHGITGDGTYIYVGDDFTTGQIIKYNTSSGAYVATIAGVAGLIGDISAYNPLGYIYSRDGNNTYAVWRTKISDGTQSWRGMIETSPTGGDTGCAGAAPGTVTPGWCTGGTSQTSTELGGFSGAYTAYYDGVGTLYVGDTNRIVRFVNP